MTEATGENGGIEPTLAPTEVPDGENGGEATEATATPTAVVDENTLETTNPTPSITPSETPSVTASVSPSATPSASPSVRPLLMGAKSASLSAEENKITGSGLDQLTVQFDTSSLAEGDTFGISIATTAQITDSGFTAVSGGYELTGLGINAGAVTITSLAGEAFEIGAFTENGNTLSFSYSVDANTEAATIVVASSSEASPSPENLISKITEENGTITGENLKELEFVITCNNSDVWGETDAYQFNLSGDDFSELTVSGDGFSLMPTDDGYTITGGNKLSKGFKLTGLNNSAFVLSVALDSGNTADLSFEYKLTLNEEKLLAIVEVTIDATEKEDPVKTVKEIKVEDNKLPSGVKSIIANFEGNGVPEGTVLLISLNVSAADREAFNSYLTTNEYAVPDGTSPYWFDVSFVDGSGNPVTIGQNVDITFTFDDKEALFSDVTEAKNYLLLHYYNGNVSTVGTMSAVSGGVTSFTLTENKFSPFALIPVTNSSVTPVAKEHNIANWINNITISKRQDDGVSFVEIDSDTVITEKDYLRVDIKFTVPEGTKIEAQDTLVYDIPLTFCSIKDVSSGEVKAGSYVAGTYTIVPGTNGGRLTISLNEEYLIKNNGRISGGTVFFEGGLDETTLQPGEDGKYTLLFGNIPFTVNFKDSNELGQGNLQIKKQYTKYETETDANGNTLTYLTYEITVTAPSSNTKIMKDVKVTDTFSTGSADIKEYEISKATVTKPDGSTFSPSADELSVVNGNLIWNIGNIDKPGNKAAVWKLTYRVLLNNPRTETKLVNDAVVTASNWDGSANSTVTVDDSMDADIIKGIGTAANPISTSTGSEVTSNSAYDPKEKAITYHIVVSAAETNARAYTAGELVVKDALTNNNLCKYLSYQKDSFVLYRGDSTQNGTDVSSDVTITAATDTVSEKFEWKVPELAAGEKVTLEYKVDVVDHSAEGTLEDDIWTRGDAANLGTSNGVVTREITNKAELFQGTVSKGSGKTKVTIGKCLLWKSNGSVNKTTNTVNFEIHANENTTGGVSSSSTPFFNAEGWVFEDKLVDAGWEFTGTLTIEAYPSGPNNLDTSKMVSKSYSFDTLSSKDGLQVTVGTDKRSFTLKVPEGWGEKYLVVKYSIKPTNGTVGALTYGNDVSFYPGTGFTGNKPTFIVHNQTANFNAGLTKTFVSQNGETASWKSQITTTVNNGDQYIDTLDSTNKGYTKFTSDTLNLVLTTDSGQNTLVSGTDYTVTIADDGMSYTVTFIKTITATTSSPITLTYNSKLMPKGEDENYPEITDSMQFINKGQLSLVNNLVLNADASFTYYNNADISKRCVTEVGKFDGETIVWGIKVNEKGTMTEATIRETLPEGLTFVSAKIENRGGTNTANAKIASTTVNNTKTEVIFKVEGMTAGGSDKNWIEIYVTTKVTDPSKYLGTTVTLTNTAELLNSDNTVKEKADASIDLTYKALNKDGVLNRSDGKISYTITVNPDGRDLLSTSQTITVVDEMSSNLMLDVDSLKVVNASGNDYTINGNEVTLHVNSNGFSLQVPDNEKLTITYKASVSGEIGSTANVNNRVYFYGYQNEETPVKNELKFTIQNSGATVESNSIELYKVSNDGDPLTGAEFEIRSHTESNPEGTHFDTVTPDTSGATKGIATVAGLQYGTLYSYREIIAPDGYLLDTTIHYFYITKEGASNPTIPESISDSISKGLADISAYPILSKVNVINKKAAFTLHKTGENGVSLAGVTFELREDSLTGTPVSKATDNNGLISFSNLSVDKTYYLVETQTLDDYKLLDAPYKIVITAEGVISTYQGKSDNKGDYTWSPVALTEDKTSGNLMLTISNDLKSGSAEFKATKKLTGRDWSDTDSFTFELKAVTDNAPMPTGSTSGSKTVVATKAEQSQSFGTIEYTTNGTYEYTIKEVEPSDAVNHVKDGLTYSTKVEYIQVVVTTGANGKEVKISTKTEANGQYTEKTGTTYEAEFENIEKSTSAEFKATKKLTGRDWSDTDSFTFELKAVTDNAPMPIGSTSGSKTVVATKAEQTQSFGTIEYTTNGTYEYTIKEVEPSDAVNHVKDGLIYSTKVECIQVVVTTGADGKEVKISSKTEANGQYTEKTGTTYEAEFENILESGYAEFYAEKILRGRNWRTSDNFSFVLQAITTGAPMPTGGSGNEKTVTADMNAQTQSFGTIEYSENGVYKYRIGEVEPAGTVNHVKDGITYSTEVVYVMVEVTGDAAGRHVQVSIASEENGTYTVQNEAKYTTVFENVFRTTSTPTPTYEPTSTPESTPEVTPTPSATPTATATPAVTPSATPTNTPGPETTPTPGNTPTATPVTRTEAPTATPVSGVLGATRVEGSTPEAAVLGAKRGLDYAVLGKRRRPSTGDSAAMLIWIITLMAGAGAVVTSIIMLFHNRKGKKK